jgi:hypothetical protein
MSATVNVNLSVEVILKLDEQQVKALDALAGYGFDAFIEVFYAKLGKHYMQPHAEGLRRLFATIKTDISPLVGEADWHRKALAQGTALLKGGKS